MKNQKLKQNKRNYPSCLSGNSNINAYFNRGSD